KSYTYKLGTIAELHSHFATKIAGDGFESLVIGAEIDVVAACDPGNRTPFPCEHCRYCNNPVRVAISQWLQQHPIHHREHCCSRADSNRERDDCNECKSGILRERSESLTKILKEVIHHSEIIRHRTCSIQKSSFHNVKLDFTI